MSTMEVIATGRPRGGSSQLTIFSVRDHELRSMKNKRTLSAEESTKLAGSSGWPVEALLETIAQSMDVQLDPASVGVFTASDGVQSEPISLADLVHGLILHSGPDGDPLSSGGPMRLWFPAGRAVQHSQCGSVGPVNLKGVVRFSLSVPAEAPPVAATETVSTLASAWDDAPLPLRVLGVAVVLAVPILLRIRWRQR